VPFGKCIISFSLYGDLSLYTEGAIENAKLIHHIYPGWIARFYIDDTVSAETRAALTAHGAEVVLVKDPSLGPMYGRYWRAWVASEPGIERFIVRDADSRINSREKAAVDAWIASGKTFHIMRDARSHGKRVLAGMWGGLGQSVPEIRSLTDLWGLYERNGDNDRFMSERIFPLMGNDYLCHDSYNHFSDARPFPPHPPMSGTSYVGEIVTKEVQAQDAWRLLAQYTDELSQAHGLIARHMQLIYDLQPIPGASRSLRLVLPLARFLRACAIRLGYAQRIPTSHPPSLESPARSLPTQRR